ncbi:MAG: M23 family metallopeptidase [Bacteroidales bacterium]|nr:M23 family metallopeptidase [Bacteroidales bacterium]
MRLLILTLIILPGIIKAQEYPQDYFRSPVDLKLVLSGTFAELRTDHFHSGIDIKTNGSKGEPVYAIAGGYVARIKVSPSGFGKALYVDHNNGYTSVYAHLSGFIPKLDSFIRAKQYEEESFAINLFPEEQQFHFKKGDVIAFSGNSGSSSGPHLHFEIRERETQVPVNPLLFGLKVRDFIRPKIKALKVYPYDNQSFIDGENSEREYDIAGWGPKYRIRKYDTIDIKGKVSFGIQTYDLLNKGINPSGNFSVQLYIDSVLQYSHYAKKFSFSESRYINAFIDYPEFMKRKRRIQKTRILPNNKLSIYKDVENNGVFSFEDDTMHEVVYLVKDINGNTSKLRFMVQAHKPGVNNIRKLHKKPNSLPLFSYDKPNHFENNWVVLDVPQYALYEDIHFQFDSIGVIDKALSPLFAVHKSTEPLHRYVELALRAPDSIPDSLRSKLLVARMDSKEFIAEGGEWKNGYVQTRVRDFGEYTLLIDTVAPLIKPLNVYDGITIKKQKSFQFRIKDEGSDIDQYRGTLNEKWILMEYDPKNDLLIYQIDNRLSKGKNDFKLEVIDERGNKQLYEATINYR